MSALQEEIRAAVRDVLAELLAGQQGLMRLNPDAARYLGVRPNRIAQIAARERFRIVRHEPQGPKYVLRSELDAYIERRAKAGDEGEAVA